MATPKKTYQHRDNKPASTRGWLKRLSNALERTNKVLTLRVLGALLGTKKSGAAIPLADVQSVLFIRYDALGDMIVTTPLWRILKRLKPSITIGVAGSFKNLDLLRSDVDIDYLYDYTASSLGDFVRLSKKTREVQWDVVFSCSFNQKTRNAIITRLATRKGITATVGAANKEGHQALFSRLVALPVTDRPMPMTSQLQHLLRSTITLSVTEDVRPSVKIDPDTERTTIVRITEILADLGRAKYVMINTDAQEKNKWGEKNSVALGMHIAQMFPEFAVLLTSLPQNKAAIESEIGAINAAHVRHFPTNDVHELTTLIRHATLVVTPDTSIAHLASAEHKPIVGFYFGISEWLPYKTPTYVILPVAGRTISTIPFDVVASVVDTALEEGSDEPSELTRVIRCGHPGKIEVLAPPISASTVAQA